MTDSSLGNARRTEGLNYGPTVATYTENRHEHDRENSIGLEAWRVELSPPGPRATTEFLVVLHATDQGTPRMAPAEPIERSGQPGVQVTVGQTVYDVTFARSGSVGGHIRIVRSGEVVLDRDLATVVQDNYRQWCADPRYKTWMTRREYENFIGRQEVHADVPENR